MKGFIHVKKKEFKSIFDGDRYAWTNNGPWQEAHINFVYDMEDEVVVGYRRTSSWGADDDWDVAKTLVPRKIHARIKKERRKERKRFKTILRKTPVIPYQGSAMQFDTLNHEYDIAYTPSTTDIDEMVDIIKDLWDDKKEN